jgi:gluconolactonase
MTKRIAFFVFLITVFTAVGQNNQSIIAPGATIKKLADGFLFTEGPAVDKHGNVFFTDQPNDRIMEWSTGGKLSVVLEKTGRANGMYFDKKGNLLSCSDLENEIWSINKKKEHTVLITDYKGKKLNGPNDLWVRPDGGIYFTDPLYARDYWARNPKKQQDGEYVFFLSADCKTLIPVATDLEQPNGIVGTPDGKLLYVADIKAGKTYIYEIQKDGSLANKKLFAAMGSDGMTIDSEGNIYLTGKGVTVFNRNGEKIEHIPVDAQCNSNVCFGGKDMKTLFITASQYLYSLKMNEKE